MIALLLSLAVFAASDLAPADDAVAQAQPGVTRAGTLRFTGDAFRGPDAAPAILARLQAGGDDAATRAALVEALHRTGGGDYDALVELMRAEPDVGVRAMMAESLDRADLDVAARGLALAAEDPAPEVRRAAMLAAGSRGDAGLVAIADHGLADEDALTRAFAARSLGWLGQADRFATLRPLLGDQEARVRLYALRALQRLDPAATAALPELAALTTDADARVSRAAQGIESSR